MELLIKVREYDKYFNLLSESKIDRDWSIFVEELTKNRELIEKFKEYLKEMNCGFLLKKYLCRFIGQEFQTNFEFQKVYYEILIFVNENYNLTNYFLRNLITNQIIKLAFMDKTGEYTQLLVKYLSDNIYKDEWIEEMLNSVKLFEALAVYYEKSEKFEEALSVYKKHFPNEIAKIEILTERIRENNSIVTCDSIEETNEEINKIL